MEAHDALERFETSHRAIEQGGPEDHYGRNAAMVVAILAGVLAIATFLANEAIKETITGETRIASISAQLDTNLTQGDVAVASSEILQAVASPANPRGERAARKAEALDARIESRLKPKDQMLNGQKAQQATDVDHSNNQHLLYEVAEIGLQIGIVLASISIIARRHWLLLGGAGMGAAGTAVLIVSFLS